jgi:quercetin dioxygenase-like cupin family protein
MILGALLAIILADVPIGLSPETIAWKEGPPTLPAGSQIAVLEGDPRANGMFTIRVRVPAGSSLAPHWHPREERVTILSGAAELGFGSTEDSAVTKLYGAGSFYVNPPRTMHFLYFPDETVMQMTGVGPWELFTTDVESKGSAKATGRLTLRNITPAPGTELGEDATIRATVDYAIDDFRPDTFHLSIQFESTTPGKTIATVIRSVGPGDVPARPPIPKMLGEAVATSVVTAKAGDTLGRIAEVKKPVRVKVYLHEEIGDGRSEVIASTDWIEYR